MTKLGRAWVYDVNISQCSDWLKDDINLPQSNHNSRIDSHDYMTTPSAGSSSSHDNMVTPPVTAHLSSSESSSRLAAVCSMSIVTLCNYDPYCVMICVVMTHVMY